ncbi:MAG: FAD-binding oxidoreductase [Acidimicrobiia bacterium]|nr:FAD-binding oxidoreductase [Acidimicrobiia bacterium]
MADPRHNAEVDWAREALREARPTVFWLEGVHGEPGRAALARSTRADLVVVGGGFTGLWAALQALEDDPGLMVVVLEAGRVATGASGRNGGFCDASLTHGLANGIAHWPDEIEPLTRLGAANLDAIEATVAHHRIDAGFRRAAETSVATEPWQLADLAEGLIEHRAHGDRVELLDAHAMRARVDSPTYLGGLVRHNDMALVDPARLAAGLARAVEQLGGTIHEQSAVREISTGNRSLTVRTKSAAIEAERVVWATNAYPGPLRGPRRSIIPVYDHVLVTEPLASGQLASIGWADNDGLSDAANQFHYYRRTDDDRILWGGYDATYHYGSGIAVEHEQSDEIHGRLAGHFFDTFPQLEGVRFSHRWAGVIATTTRFTAAWGKDFDGRLSWIGGYTGLGVGASRFGARVALDLVFGRDTEVVHLGMVQRRPFPFPPEPLRWTGVQLTRRAIQKADRRQGRRGPWLRLLDRFGVGFDS